MNKRLVIVGALVFTVVTVFLSIFVVKPPKPMIEITGEPIFTVGPLDVLNTLLTSWIIMGLLLLICFLATRRIAMVPSGFYNFFEAIIEGIDSFIKSIAGEHNGRRMFPLVATFFIYIAFANWVSLTPLFNTVGIYVPLHADEASFHEDAVVFKDSGGVSLILPGAKTVEIDAAECAVGAAGDECRHHAIDEVAHDNTKEGEKLGVLFPFLRGINTDLMTPLSFALISVFFIEYWGVTTLGFFAYMSKFINFRGPIDFFVGILELVAELARLISFSFRLFGNMLAGEILLLVMTFLVAVASPILVVFYGLELFVGAIQAFVFGTLTLVFGVLAMSSHGDEHGHAEEAHEH